MAEQETLKTPQEGTYVMPGDALAASEEVLPGDGTYDDGLEIRAARVGRFRIDPDEHKAVVDALTSTPAVVRVGQTIIGRVYMLKPVMAGVNVEQIVGQDRVVSGDTNGTLHVSKIADRYVEDVGREYRLGDLLRCQVIQVEPSIQLTTDFDGGGCVKAFCLRCRNGLILNGKSLECPNCGRRETRNLAPDYGEGVLEVSDEAIERAKQEKAKSGRNGGGGRRGGGGRGRRGGGGGRGRRGGGGGKGGRRGGRKGD